MDARTSRRAVFIAALIAGCIGVAVLKTIPPTDDSFYPGCWVQESTRLHCPACGTTRAAHSLLNGDVPQAMAWNAVGLVLVLLIVISTYRSLLAWVRQDSLSSVKSCRWQTLAIAAALVLYTVARNLPFAPFSLLSPHALSP